MEAMQPAPDGERVEGYAANVRYWQAMVFQIQTGRSMSKT